MNDLHYHLRQIPTPSCLSGLLINHRGRHPSVGGNIPTKIQITIIKKKQLKQKGKNLSDMTGNRFMNGLFAKNPPTLYQVNLLANLDQI